MASIVLYENIKLDSKIAKCVCTILCIVIDLYVEKIANQLKLK